jgi:cbb3-type cytochrome oxidase maturation protein
MNILLVLVPLSLALVACALWAFFWAVGSGQFEDLTSSGWQVLLDEETPATRSPGSAGLTNDD